MRSIECHFACTNDKVINYFDDSNRYYSFLENGTILYEGLFEELKVGNCDFYFINNNVIFAINNVSQSILSLTQNDKYTYCFTSPVYGKKRKLNKSKSNNLSFLITMFEVDKQFNENLLFKKLPTYYLDYYNKEKMSNRFFPVIFSKKSSLLNLAISKINCDKIAVIDSSNSIDLKFLSESLKLDNNSILVPNILHMNNDILPFSISKELFFNNNMINNSVFIRKALYHMILNAFINGYNIKTYPSVIAETRIRGDFDNILESQKNDILQNFAENFIIKPEDIYTYNSVLEPDSCIDFK